MISFGLLFVALAPGILVGAAAALFVAGQQGLATLPAQLGPHVTPWGAVVLVALAGAGFGAGLGALVLFCAMAFGVLS